MSTVFDRSNLVEYPNPKPLTVIRVNVQVSKGENVDQYAATETAYIRNANVDISPAAIARGR